MGDLDQAEALGRQLDRAWPLGTYVQKYWLPTIRAEIDLRRKNPAKAIEDLGAPTLLEFSNPGAIATAPLYPIYVRGQAFLAAGDGQKAVAEFKKLIDNPGVLTNCPLGSLVHLQIARAYQLATDSADARREYQIFLNRWKDADPGLLILKQAKAEYARLQ